MFFRRKQPAVSREEALRSRPRRLVEAEMKLREDGSGAGILRVPLAPPRSRLGRVLFRVPTGATKAFEFDAIGVFVWNRCDGTHTVQQMIRKLAAEYSLNLREAEVATLQFLHTLARKGLIGMTVKQRK